MHKLVSLLSELVAVFVFTAIIIFAISYLRQWLFIEQSQCYWDGILRAEYCTFVNNTAKVLSSLGLY